MDRRHGLFIAIAIGLAAIAGTYAAFQTTDLGVQAKTASQEEIAAADVRLDRQEAALRRAARKRPPKLPKLPRRASAAGAGAGGSVAMAAVSAPVAGAAPAAAPPPAPQPRLDSSGHGDDDLSDWEDDGEDAYEDYLDEREDALEDAAEEREDSDE